MGIFVLYHANCYDGFGAAFAAWKKLGFTANYIPVNYESSFPYLPNLKHLYLLDFSYDKNILLDLANKGVKITVLDHHATAQEHYKGLKHENIEIIIDLSKSGAGLTWDYFHGSQRPKLINLIEDRDLWLFYYGQETKHLHSYLATQPFNFFIYDSLLNEETLNKAILEGKLLQAMTDQIVEKICENARVYENFFGFKAVVVNTSSHWSEVGSKLLELYPDVDYAVSYTDLPNDIRMFSLRSKPPFNVAKIAEIFGGGGHPQAAGFRAKLKVPFEKTLYVKNK